LHRWGLSCLQFFTRVNLHVREAVRIKWGHPLRNVKLCRTDSLSDDVRDGPARVDDPDDFNDCLRGELSSSAREGGGS